MDRAAQTEKDQELARIYADIGLGYLKRGEYERAQERLEKAVKLDPNLPRAHHYVAEVYKQLGKEEQADFHFRRAIELKPNDPNLQNNFAVFLCSRNRLGEAESLFLNAAQNSNYATPYLAYENAGRCALREPDKEKAESYFERALEYQPKLPHSLSQMARLQSDKGEYLKARAYLERYFDVAAPTAELVWLGIRIEEQLGDRAMVANYGDILKKRFAHSHEAELLRTMEAADAMNEVESEENGLDVTLPKEGDSANNEKDN